MIEICDLILSLRNKYKIVSLIISLSTMWLYAVGLALFLYIEYRQRFILLLLMKKKDIYLFK